VRPATVDPGALGPPPVIGDPSINLAEEIEAMREDERY
jgi:hypothetical protein